MNAEFTLAETTAARLRRVTRERDELLTALQLIRTNVEFARLGAVFSLDKCAALCDDAIEKVLS